ncbi:MAG: hypothetical protein K2J42_05320 [Muribaculaceae bacterium]|nr:hypothetical protein [Muribaculaceae bacterium]
MSEFGIVTLRDLEEFQGELKKLSTVLDNYYNTVSRGLQITGQTWRDNKFEEFERDFRKYKEEIKRISEEYYRWASGYLQEEIDHVREFNNVRSVE